MVNEETIVMISTLTVFWAIWKFGGPMYKEWADKEIAKIQGIMDQAKADHKQAVVDRMDNVKELGGVIDITKSLFEVSKVRSNRTLLR